MILDSQDWVRRNQPNHPELKSSSSLWDSGPSNREKHGNFAHWICTGWVMVKGEARLPSASRRRALQVLARRTRGQSAVRDVLERHDAGLKELALHLNLRRIITARYEFACEYTPWTV